MLVSWLYQAHQTLYNILLHNFHGTRRLFCIRVLHFNKLTLYVTLLLCMLLCYSVTLFVTLLLCMFLCYSVCYSVTLSACVTHLNPSPGLLSGVCGTAPHVATMNGLLAALVATLSGFSLHISPRSLVATFTLLPVAGNRNIESNESQSA